MKVDSREINITNPHKLMYPQNGITKLQVVEYYLKVAEYMLPHIRDRPLVMQRFPDGIDQDGFFQKEASSYFPKWIKTVSVNLVQGGKQRVVIADSPEVLAYLANQAALVLHVWLSTVKNLNMPDVMVFDLDPSDNDFSKVIKTARILRGILIGHGYQPRLMTTGAHGLHLIVALQPNRSFDTVRAESQAIAAEAVSKDNSLLTTEARINKRGDKVYIDTARNSYGQTRVAPYSLRALPGAPVATPIAWSELTSRLIPQKYNLRNIPRRLAARPDPWNQ